MSDPALVQTLETKIRDLEKRIALIERSPKLRPISIPTVISLGTPQPAGFVSYDLTTFSEALRSEVHITAPWLEYDIETWNAFAPTATSIDWQLRVSNYKTLASLPDGIVVASGTSTDSTERFSGYVDLFTTHGPEILGSYAKISLDMKRTGGSGEAAIRLYKPLMLRVGEFS